MNNCKYLRRPLLAALAVGCAAAFCSRSGAQQGGQSAPASVPLRALVVGGGPSGQQAQAGIESNARYVSTLLAGAASQRVLWNNGQATSATVASVAADRDGYLRRLAFAFAFDQDWPEEPVSLRAPKLPRLDGAVTQKNVASEIGDIGRALGEGETALLYFTGHGSPGVKPGGEGAARGSDAQKRDDYENTVYWMWGNRGLSVRDLAPTVQALPERNPVVMVMVQCYSGGFANLMFEGGDPRKPLANRDLCGFFASTADRMSSGCTPSIDEVGSEDFTTHFFAALSGQGRGGRPVYERDFDRDGRTSMLEAFAYANLHDTSIDVPTCTSEEFLGHLFRPDESWYRIPSSRVEAAASPWQKAMLRGLSQRLKLSGEGRLAEARKQARSIAARDEDAGGTEDAEVWPQGVLQQADSLRRVLETRQPRLKSPGRAPGYGRARQAALKYLEANPALWRGLARDIERASSSMVTGEVREAMLTRFVDASLTVIAEGRLRQSGTPEQKAAFARLRASEGRSLFAKS